VIGHILVLIFSVSFILCNKSMKKYASQTVVVHMVKTNKCIYSIESPTRCTFAIYSSLFLAHYVSSAICIHHGVHNVQCTAIGVYNVYGILIHCSSYWLGHSHTFFTVKSGLSLNLAVINVCGCPSQYLL
jgi:hypothetical protein